MASRSHISTTILTLVTLVMLLTGVLPHHHHDEEICFADSHCRAEEVHHPHPCSEGHESHAHDMPGEEGSCMLMNEYLLPDMNIRPGRPEVDRSTDPGNGFTLLCCKDPELVVSPVRQSLFPMPDMGIPCCSRSCSYTLRGPPALA